jgi:hypothetical protein
MPNLPPMPRLCTGLTAAGNPCRFVARHGRPFCINHDPDYHEQQRDNVLRGARISRAARKAAVPLRLDAIDLSTRAGVQAALDAVIRLELLGRIPERRARNLIRALSVAVRNFDVVPHWHREQGRLAGHTADYYLRRSHLGRRLEAICRAADLADESRK